MKKLWISKIGALVMGLSLFHLLTIEGLGQSFSGLNLGSETRETLRGDRPGNDVRGPIESGEIDIISGDSKTAEDGRPDDPFSSLPDPKQPFDPSKGKGKKPDEGQKGEHENARKFPKHWGKPPAVQTRDLVRLPGNFGFGSSTLARWIKMNMEKDAKHREQGGPEGKGPEGKGPEGKGPEGKGPEGKGPEGKGPEGEACEVTLYGRPTCGLCKATKAALKKERILFAEKNIDSDKKAQKEMWDHVGSTGHKGGSITLPVVVANGKVFLTPTKNLGKFINDIKNACKATK